MWMKACCQMLVSLFRQKINEEIRRKGIPGFTLLEQILVLALTTIVVLIGFTAVLNINRLMEKVRGNAAIDRNIYLLHHALDNDMRNAETVSWDGGLRFEKTTGPVSYEFERFFLVRESREAIDTFWFATSDWAVAGCEGNLELVEHVTFHLSCKDQACKMSFIKKYPDFKIMEKNNHGN